MDSVRNILRLASGKLENGWLYLPNGKLWGLDTLGIIINIDELEQSEVGEDDEPIFAIDNGLVSTLESAAIEDIVSFAKSIRVKVTDEFLLESFLYYYEYDAFLPEPGFKPPSREESEYKHSREFYESLGNERPNERCKKADCSRGAIERGVFCKIHHFEMIKKKPCPFTD